MATPVVVGWNYQVVLLSYILSVFGSWTTLLLIEHACVVEAREQLVAFLGSSVAMGVCAFWSMPVTGLLASEMGSLVHFNIPWAAGSVFVAVVLCGVGIWKIISLTLARRKAGHAQTAVVTLQRLLLSGVWTGSGIASMHYMGVNSMTMEGMAPRFDCTLVALSIVIAIIGASGAFCVFHYSSTTAGHIFAAFVMGAAVCGMHYTGMAASSYHGAEISVPSASWVYTGKMDDKTLVWVTALITCIFCFMLGGLMLRIRDSKNLLSSLVKERTAKLAEEQARSDALLYSLLPHRVAEILKSGGLPPNRSYDDASVLFIDIVGFTSLCARSTPQQIVDLLNRVFDAYDKLVLRYGLSKIDMIGDCLIVAAGVPDPTEDHVIRIVDFALEALEALTVIDMSDQEASQICARVGICSGPLVSGVVGLVMPHYSLFGDTVNVAARMEQTSFPGKIHYTGQPDHIEALARQFVLIKRAAFEVKGKENVALDTFWIEGPNAKHEPAVLGPVALFAQENRSLVGLRRKGSINATPPSGTLKQLEKCYDLSNRRHTVP